jgi:hypothetical protein
MLIYWWVMLRLMQGQQIKEKLSRLKTHANQIQTELSRDIKSYLAVLPLRPSCDNKIASLAVFVIFLTYFF